VAETALFGFFLRWLSCWQKTNVLFVRLAFFNGNKRKLCMACLPHEIKVNIKQLRL